ncbi:MAG: polysaccharide pyruvyl transferase family protein [Bacteroidaceae bacterium]|nr:polysaccharide pyruvyl transferase family protein [Bacteroidaceae bacterium]
MKVGILTFHRAHNYGAVLQCYALSKTLQSLGYDVEIIDYYPTYFKEEYSSFSINRFRKLSLVSKLSYIFSFLRNARIKRKHCLVFDKFINDLPLSSCQYTEYSLPPQGYDCIFFGSDQIWNPLLTKGEDKMFSGNFKVEGTSLIAYAASTNPSLCTNEYREYFSGIISRFKYISTREKSLCCYLNEIQPSCGRVVLDPVLLLNEEKWTEIAVEPKIKDYLLIYTVPQSDKVWELANLIAKEKGLEIVEVRPNANKVNNKKGKGTILKVVSPNEFLGYFLHASYVVTTSFHGTAFSVKFQKEFVTLSLGGSIDDRAVNLLSSIGLSDRMISHENLYSPSTAIDYNKVNMKLEIMIKDSINYIDLATRR